jgi:uncharacterized membrane protein
MLLDALIPTLPASALELCIFYASISGGVLLVYSQFIEAENRRDIVRMCGALGVLTYALWIQNLLFCIIFLGIFCAALIEFIEILAGYHKHINSPGAAVFDHIHRTGLFWKKK